jgi:tetratricopeptide (TPR) repeat protein
MRLLTDRGLSADETELPDSVQALIAARLDTLSPERKALLHDAAVLGKVFWVGALAAMSGRDAGELELALHDLSRKELIRPSRTSAMEGESEYSFWHLLVRDVAYSQIPRVERARRHRAVAAWIEHKAGERIEDLAEVLAHHYLQALELAEASGDTKQAHDLVLPARRFLALAGERALGLDTAQAETRLARALELCPLDDPERPALLVRWADATFQAGRPREAAAALEEAIGAFRARGDTEATALALTLLARVTISLGEGRDLALAAEAVSLLEPVPVPALVAAYEQLAGGQFLAGAYGEAIAAAGRAVVLAERLGLPPPAHALGVRGVARAFSGDPDGLAEMERAIALMVDAGAGRAAGSVQNNLAIARYPLQGPAASLAAFERGIAFCEQRGLLENVWWMEADCPGLLVELGRADEALERAGRLAAAAEARGSTHLLIWLRALMLATHVARGEVEAAPDLADWLVKTVHAAGQAAVTVEALASAASARLASGQKEQARELLAELEQTPGAREIPYYARQLPLMLRTAVAAGDSELAQRLVDGLEPVFPLREHALCAARAQLAEHSGNHGGAAALYADAAARWQEFGNIPERAYALLGQGRCLIALGDLAAEKPLRQAAELFRSMNYRPAVAQTEALLEQTTAPES